MWVISAEREFGKSLRRIRVRDMWWGCWGSVEVEVEEGGWTLGVRDRVQASFGRKRGAEFEEAEVDDREACWGLTSLCRGAGFEGLLRVSAMRSSCRASSHCVSQAPAMKSACEMMAVSMARLVLIPVMVVSCNARRALRTAASHVLAVMMSFAITESKSALTMAGAPWTRAVSTRIPLPEGKWKDWILPMLSE